MGGGDKALLPLAGRPLLAHVVGGCAPQVGALALSANGDPARFAAFGLPVIADGAPAGAGPLAGVLAGLDWAAALGAARSSPPPATARSCRATSSPASAPPGRAGCDRRRAAPDGPGGTRPARSGRSRCASARAALARGERRVGALPRRRAPRRARFADAAPSSTSTPPPTSPPPRRCCRGLTAGPCLGGARAVETEKPPSFGTHALLPPILARAGLHTAAFYVVCFAMTGAHLPFWPLWLERLGADRRRGRALHRGRMAVRVVAGLAIPALADRLDAGG